MCDVGNDNTKWKYLTRLFGDSSGGQNTWFLTPMQIVMTHEIDNDPRCS